MEYEKVLNSLNESSDSKFLIRNWNLVNDQLNANCNVGYEIICSTEVLKSNLSNFNNSSILVRGNITIKGRNDATQVAFKNCAPFTKCIAKIVGTTTGNAEDLDLVM